MPRAIPPLPTGITPRFLSRAQAAAYVGVSPRTFDEEVAAGQWPGPRRRGAKGSRLTWDRDLLDRFADAGSGLAEAEPAPAGKTPLAHSAPPAAPLRILPQVAQAAEAAALQGILNAAPRHRPKHRQPPAA